MFAKEITYIDYNGDERKETYRFNLNKAELVEMDMNIDGGMETMVKRIIEEKNSRELMKMFKEIVLKSYGVKSDDGKRFVKSKELREAFEQTEAYSELVVELMSNPDAAAEFVNKIVPAIPNNVSSIPAPKN